MLENASRGASDGDGALFAWSKVERGDEIPADALPADIVLCLTRGWAALERRLPDGRRQYLDLYRPATGWARISSPIRRRVTVWSPSPTP